MRVLAFAASVRTESWNLKLIKEAATVAREFAEVELADFRSFDMPLYDGDRDHEEGLPPGALALKRQVERSDAIMIAVPEYNYSIPGTLKNAVDWVSRARPMPFRGRSIYLMSASPSPMGGIRGLWQTRIPLEGCGALVFPDMYIVPHANKAFDEQGRLIDGAARERLRKEVVGFLTLVNSYGGLWTDPSQELERRRITEALEEQSDLQPAE